VRRASLAALARALAAAAAVGTALLAVGLDDRVTDRQGAEHRGEVVSRSPEAVVLWAGGRETVVEVDDPRSVRTGLRSTFSALAGSPLPAVAAAALQAAGIVVVAMRWRLLLGGAGLPTPLPSALRLAWIGLFAANLLPGGAAGGDVVRAVGIAKAHPDSRARAALTVLGDRLVGIFALCAVALAAVLAAPAGSPVAAAGPVVLGLFAAGAAALALVLLPRLRAAVGLPRLVARLPGRAVLAEAGEAAALCARRPAVLAGAVLLSFAAHALVLGSHALYARSLGAPLPWVALLAAVPVAQMLQSVPGLPGGWGAGELAYFLLLPAAGVPAAQAVALSVTVRMAYAALSLPGGLLLATPRQSPNPVS
jgi:uncharacterized membrane protein YbhN (UPF0104 family)